MALDVKYSRLKEKARHIYTDKRDVKWWRRGDREREREYFKSVESKQTKSKEKALNCERNQKEQKKIPHNPMRCRSFRYFLFV